MTGYADRSGNQRCDFCTGMRAQWLYRCGDFLAGTVVSHHGVVDVVSSDAWLACSPCSALIEAHEWEDLADRATRTYIKARGRGGLTEEVMREMIAATQQGFRTYKKSQPREAFG
jgi:hypothetical protein